MNHDPSARLSELSKILLSRTPIPSLLAPPPPDTSKPVTSTAWDAALHEKISRLEQDANAPRFGVASLHLFNDDIGSCHEIVEKHGGHAIADYLHYLLHRREGDYWNAKWWIRQLKSEEFQSVYLSEKYQSFGQPKNAKQLSSDARLAETHARAQAFVDRCAIAEKQEDPKEKEQLTQMQWDELKTVFDFARR